MLRKRENKLEIETLEIEYEQLKEKYTHKSNELFDLLSLTFNNFRKIIEIAERNNYGNPQQKIRQIKEFAEEQKNYYAQLITDTPIGIKNRTTTTTHSNK